MGKSMRFWIGVAMAAASVLMSCSSSSNGTGGTASGSKKGESCAKSPDCAQGLKCIELTCVPDLPTGFCQQYADLCGEEPDSPVSECEAKCFDTTGASGDDCWFPACGVITGKCDGQEPDDESISACADQRGWR